MDGYVRIWAEDDALPHDGEGVLSAYRRLVGDKHAQAHYSKDAVTHEDQGDCDLYTLANGIRVVSSYPGNSALYAPVNYRFVFGSNLAGRHGVGAAKTARDFFKAKYGQGAGPQGLSYAIPTRYSSKPHGKIDQSCSLDAISDEVGRFAHYVHLHPELYFDVTRIGCGRAGYTDAQIAPLFRDIAPNVHLPKEWLP